MVAVLAEEHKPPKNGFLVLIQLMVSLHSLLIISLVCLQRGLTPVKCKPSLYLLGRAINSDSTEST